MPRCPPGSLRSVQLDHLVGIKNRAVCNQHSSVRRSHVSILWVPVMYIYAFYIYAFSRRFYPKQLTIQAIHFFLSMCVPWELNPQPFALLTQCSTTEPQEHCVNVVHMEKSRGPRTDPWGTPVTRWYSLETFPLQATLKDLPVGSDSNEGSGVPLIPNDERVDRRIWWLVLKPADRSN